MLPTDIIDLCIQSNKIIFYINLHTAPVTKQKFIIVGMNVSTLRQVYKSSLTQKKLNKLTHYGYVDQDSLEHSWMNYDWVVRQHLLIELVSS